MSIVPIARELAQFQPTKISNNIFIWEGLELLELLNTESSNYLKITVDSSYNDFDDNVICIKAHAQNISKNLNRYHNFGYNDYWVYNDDFGYNNFGYNNNFGYINCYEKFGIPYLFERYDYRL
ncbi:hypothetical protein HHI36_014393 [Cryptolaemus montrouzieri]|uniref:Uncharacterized protein n=1 Tax=Cryptolaemus montrouzieri TaxID=559131 RepID=A0ABD2N2P3_9CUCU